MENIVDKVKHASEGLKFCPECGQKLQSRPLQGDTKSCFVHGDFVILFVDGDLQVRWSALRMVGIYLKETKQPESIYHTDELSDDIKERFLGREIDLMEAWRMHRYSQGDYRISTPDLATLEKFYSTHLRSEFIKIVQTEDAEDTAKKG